MHGKTGPPFVWDGRQVGDGATVHEWLSGDDRIVSPDLGGAEISWRRWLREHRHARWLLRIRGAVPWPPGGRNRRVMREDHVVIYRFDQRQVRYRGAQLMHADSARTSTGGVRHPSSGPTQRDDMSPSARRHAASITGTFADGV